MLPLIDKTGKGEGKVPTVGRKMWDVGVGRTFLLWMGTWRANFLKSARWRNKIP